MDDRFNYKTANSSIRKDNALEKRETEKQEAKEEALYSHPHSGGIYREIVDGIEMNLQDLVISLL